jgi:AraC-like DNA-binding protein
MEGMRDELELFQELMTPVFTSNTLHYRVHSSFNVVVPRGWRFENRRNEDLHIVFVRGGRGHYVIQDRRVDLHRGRIIFVAARCTHSAYKDPHDPPEIIPVRFGIYSNDDKRMVEHRPGGFSIDFAPTNVRRFETLFEMLHTHNQLDPDGFGRSLCSSILNQILIETWRDVSQRRGGRRFDERLEKVRQHLETHPHDPLDLDRLAEIGNLSRKYLSKRFALQYGVSPRAYLLRARMNIAYFLVQHSGKSMKEIAADMGYADQYTFSKQFKRVFSIPPSEAKDDFATPEAH